MNSVIIKLIQNADRTQDENQIDDHSDHHTDDHIQSNYFNHPIYDKPLYAFDSLLTIYPAILPYRSAAALQFSLGDTDSAAEDHLPRGREVRDQRWQIFGLLSERSTIKQAIRNSV